MLMQILLKMNFDTTIGKQMKLGYYCSRGVELAYVC
jgi:hypothetical protein